MIRDRLGQHFLIDRSVALRIAGYADLVDTDRVLEIGPGTGNLTEVLAPRASRVYSIEVDPHLAGGLLGVLRRRRQAVRPPALRSRRRR